MTNFRHDLPTKDIVRAPNLVASVSMLYLRSPSTSGKSFVIAMTVANTVTKDVTNLYRQQKVAEQLFEHRTYKPVYSQRYRTIGCCTDLQTALHVH